MSFEAPKRYTFVHKEQSIPHKERDGNIATELDRLVALDRKVTLAYREGGNLCGSTGNNMVGALVFAHHQQAFLDVYAKRRFTPPAFALKPIEIHDDVALYVRDENNDIQIAPFTAPKVLFKNICGLQSGVVIQGELTGLVLERMIDFSPSDALCVNQIWRDTPLTQKRPYVPQFHRLSSFEDQKDPTAPQLEEELKVLYTTKLDAVLQQGDFYPSQVFSELCEQLGIPLDRENFTVMRDDA